MRLRMGSAKSKVCHLLKMRNNKEENLAYTNWFQLHLWPPIVLQQNKIYNNSNAIHFLKTTQNKPNMPSPSEKLHKACLWDWSTTSNELKPN